MGSEREADEVGDPHHGGADNRLVVEVLGGDEEDEAVSYTHLTLPTIYSV